MFDAIPPNKNDDGTTDAKVTQLDDGQLPASVAPFILRSVKLIGVVCRSRHATSLTARCAAGWSSTSTHNRNKTW